MRWYLGISCTGLTENHEPFNAFWPLRQGSHTGEAIFAEYESVMKIWDITNKVNKYFPFKDKNEGHDIFIKWFTF
jgi:hypothetical protein